MLRNLYRGRWGLFFIAPNYILFLLFMLLPLLASIGLSFFDVNLVSVQWTGLDNYLDILEDAVFRRALVNTLLFVVGVVPATVILALLISVAIFPLRPSIQTVFRVAYYLPVIMSGVVISMVWKWMLHPVIGVLNYMLAMIGLPPSLWTADPNLALPTLVGIVLTFTLGEAIILMLAGLGSISTELWDAARVDGANEWQRFFLVTVPLLRPSILYVVVTQTIAVFQIWIVVALLTRGGPAYATQTLVFYIYQTAFTQIELGLAAAQGVVLTLFIAVVAVAQFRLLGEAVEL